MMSTRPGSHGHDNEGEGGPSEKNNFLRRRPSKSGKETPKGEAAK